MVGEVWDSGTEPQTQLRRDTEQNQTQETVFVCVGWAIKVSAAHPLLSLLCLCNAIIWIGIVRGILFCVGVCA